MKLILFVIIVRKKRASFVEENGIYCLSTDVMNQTEEMTGRQKLEPGNRAYLTCLAQQLTTVLLLSLSSVKGPHKLHMLTHSIRFLSLFLFSTGLLKAVGNCHSETHTLGQRFFFFHWLFCVSRQFRYE